MPLATRPSSLSEPDRVEFVLSNFEQALKDHGLDVVWSKATLCPNRDPTQPGHERLSCALCDENGWVYFDPQPIRVLAMSHALRQMFMPESRYEPGTAYVTAQAEHKLSFFDKLELTESKARFYQVVPVEGVTYRLKYKVLEIVHIIKNDGTTIEPKAVLVNADGSITFGDTPDAEFLSISYTHRPVYIVQDILHYIRNRRQTEAGSDVLREFPNQAMVKLDFLVRDESAD